MGRTRVVGLTLCLLAMSILLEGQRESEEATKIRALEAKAADCYKQRQLDVLASLLDDNFVITFEDGSSYGKTGYISYSSTSVRADISEVSDLKIRMHGDTSVVTGSYHEKGNDKGEDYDYHDVFTDVSLPAKK
jgi:hypothetical protein